MSYRPLANVLVISCALFVRSVVGFRRCWLRLLAFALLTSASMSVGVDALTAYAAKLVTSQRCAGGSNHSGPRHSRRQTRMRTHCVDGWHQFLGEQIGGMLHKPNTIEEVIRGVSFVANTGELLADAMRQSDEMHRKPGRRGAAR